MTERPTVVLKIGGELLQDHARTEALAAAIARCLATARIAVVHGGGNEVSAALNQAGIQPRKVDGIRVTDGPTLDVVVSVLGGLVNTRLVAALVAAGAPAVGLSGADARCVPVLPAPPAKSTGGASVDLGFVGTPNGRGEPALIVDLLERGYLPVLASIGLGAGGALFNVNADAFAADLAGRLGADRLVIAGATRGVYDGHGRTIADLDPDSAAVLIASREASDGMVAKLRSATDAALAGVPEIFIADGANPDALADLVTHGTTESRSDYTRLTAAAGSAPGASRGRKAGR